MGNLKSIALLALLFSLSLAVFADTSNDATYAKDEVKPSTEASDAIEPQQREPKPEIEEAQVEASDAVVEPQQVWGGGCRFGCCGGLWYGGCLYCCMSPAEANEVAETVEPQQGSRGGGGGCRYGCCGGWIGRRCRYCCRNPAKANEVVKTVEPDVVEPQQRRGCRYGCCGSYAYGQCSACCSKKIMATEKEKKKKEAKP